MVLNLRRILQSEESEKEVPEGGVLLRVLDLWESIEDSDKPWQKYKIGAEGRGKTTAVDVP